MFFINSKKNFSRVVGYVFCAILLVVCALLLVAAFMFGARGTVEVFGFNIYIAQTDEFEAINEGSALFVKRCEPYDINDGNLILYYSDEFTPTLGYTDGIRMEDGSYIISVSDSNGSRDIQADAFVGKAETSSAFLGAIIGFARQPVGVLVMAVLPCVALVIYDIIRARAAALPPPEVEPVYKNVDEDKPTSAKGISVKPDGNAQYSRKSAPSPSNDSADKVLFTYGSSMTGKQRPACKTTEIIPLTDKTAQKPTAAKSSVAPAEKSHSLPLYPNKGVEVAEKPAGSADSALAAHDIATSKTPSSVAARRYLDTAVQSVSSATAELPDIPKKQKKDAFFPQSKLDPQSALNSQETFGMQTEISQLPSASQKSIPQIGRQKSTNRELIELEDALSTARSSERTSSVSREYSGKKSSAMIASHSAELFTEDDDSRDRERYEVDDILAGLEKRRKK